MDATTGLGFGTRWRRRALLVAVIAALVVAVVLAIVQVFPRGGTLAAVPGDGGLPQGPLRITGIGYFQQRGDDPPVMCIGGVGESLPAHCTVTVPVTGLDWDQVPDANEHGETREGEAIVIGLWQDGVLAVESVAKAVHPDRPVGERFVQLCNRPSTGTDRPGMDRGPDLAALEALDGYQAGWVTHPAGRSGAGSPTVFNIATTGDPSEAARIARQSYGGPLCVGSIAGPTDRALRAATERLQEQRAALTILYSASGVTGRQNGLSVGVFIATDAVVARIHDVVGADIARWTTVDGQFRTL